LFKNYFLAGGWGERIVLALLFVAIGSLIMIVFSPWRPLLGKINDYLGRIGLITLLVVAVLLARQSNHFEKYWLILFGFLIMAVAVSLDWVFGVYLIDHLGIKDTTPAGWALPKLNECIVIISVIILCTKMSSSSLGSIYLQNGNLKLGLVIGLITFFLAAAGSVPMANLLNARELNFARILPWGPWLLIYVFTNAAMEELLFRGLFLHKLEPFFGMFFSIIIIALVFTALHRAANYTSDEVLFLAVLFPLSLAWGYIMQTTESV
jgi:membrane protease YdiL (CAAX protease family)